MYLEVEKHSNRFPILSKIGYMTIHGYMCHTTTSERLFSAIENITVWKCREIGFFTWKFNINLILYNKTIDKTYYLRFRLVKNK